MKKILVLAALPLLATPAFADMNAEIDMAKAEAQKAADATDMELIQRHLQRANNCLVNPSVGSWWPKVGTPCDGMGDGAIADSTLSYQKDKLSETSTHLSAGCNQSVIADAQRYAREAIKMLDKAKAAKE